MMVSRAAWTAFFFVLGVPTSTMAQMAQDNPAPASATLSPPKAAQPNAMPVAATQPTTAKKPATEKVQTSSSATSSGTSRDLFDAKVQREADERVRKSEGELGYLGAAYAAAFFILGIFLWSTRRGQQRLTEEIEELRARLDQAHREASGSDS